MPDFSRFHSPILVVCARAIGADEDEPPCCDVVGVSLSLTSSVKTNIANVIVYLGSSRIRVNIYIDVQTCITRNSVELDMDLTN